MVMIYEERKKYEADTGKPSEDNIWFPDRCPIFTTYIQMKAIIVVF